MTTFTCYNIQQGMTRMIDWKGKVLYKSLNRADVEIDEIEDDKHVSGGPNEK